MLSYRTQVWSPYLAKDIKTIERVQKRCAKNICRPNEFNYKSRLLDLKALSLQKHCTFSDMVFIYKALHGKINCEPENFGIRMSYTRIRGEQSGKLVKRRPPSIAAASLFSFRSPST